MSRYPLIKINIIFITGIIIQSSFTPGLWILLSISSVLLILTLLLFFLKINRATQLLLLLLVAIAGALSYYFAWSGLKEYPFKDSRIRNAFVYGTVKDIQPVGSYELKFKLHTDSVIIKAGKYQIDHIILCRIRDNRSELFQLANIIAPGNYIALYGTILKPSGQRNPGEFDYRNYLHRENISALFTSYDCEGIRLLNPEADYLKNAIFSVQKIISGAIEGLLNEDSEALLKGLILADRSGIDPEIMNDFINSGVVHILSVSGLHIGYIILIFIFLTGRLNFTNRIPLIITGIIVYTAITGAPPSVLRAALMSILIFIALLTNRSTNIANILSFTCLLFLLYNPLDLFHPGFQLSYAAVGSIALFYHYFGETFKQLALKNKWLSKISVFFLISLFAQLGTLPFTIYYFGRLSVISLIANIFVIPAAGIILGAGIFMLVVNIFWTAGALLCSSAINFLVYLLYFVVRFFSDTRWAYLSINHFSIQDAVIFYSFSMMLLLLISKLRGFVSKIIIVPLVALIIITFCNIDDQELLPDNKLSILAIDVGQGDAFLIKFPDGKTALIDAGEATEYFDNGKRVIIPLLEKLGIEKIDYGFISHMDVDHYEGFISLVKENKIKMIYKPVPVNESEKELQFETWLKGKNIPVYYYKKEIIRLGNVRLYLLNNPVQTAYFNMNDRSGVIKLQYGHTSILFTGDTEREGERFLISSYRSFLRSDILKLGHHGSRNGTSDEFLNLVEPKYALISAGAYNKFNHPSTETLKRLKKRGIKQLRTDLNGAIAITSDGDNIEILNWK